MVDKLVNIDISRSLILAYVLYFFKEYNNLSDMASIVQVGNKTKYH